MSFHDIEQFLKEKETKQIIKEGLDKADQLLDDKAVNTSEQSAINPKPIIPEDIRSPFEDGM